MRNIGLNKIRLAILFIFFTIMGFMLTFGAISDIIRLKGDMRVINLDDMRNVKKGDIVYGIVWNVYGNYAHQTTTETTMGIKTSSYTSREYFVMGVYPNDGDEEFFITLSASKKYDTDMIHKIISYESTSEDWDDHPEYIIYAKVNKLDSELNGFLADGIAEWEIFDSRAELQRHIIPFELIVYDPKTPYTNLTVGLIMLAVVIIAGFIFWKKFMPKRTAPESFSGAETGAANGFSETYAPPRPLPSVSQPADPEEFFPTHKPKNKPEPVSEPKPEPEPKEPPKPVSTGNYEDTHIDTSGLDTNQKLAEQEQAIAANARHIEYDNKLETDGLDTDQKLYEQEQAVAANARQIEYDNQLETDDLDTDQKLYEQEQAIAANARQIEYDNQLETDGLDTDQKLYEQEQALAANVRKTEYDNEIDTSDLNTDSLEYYDASAQSDDDDIFIFDNDLYFEDADASKIEISD